MSDTPDSSVLSETAVSSGINPVRLEKLHLLREAGYDPFAPETYERTHPLTDIADKFALLENETVRVAGRISSKRGQGKVLFMDLRDESGRAQIYLKQDDLGEPFYKALQSGLDIGDFLGVEGFVFRTKTGEPSVHAKSATILAKALRDVPFGKEYEGGSGESGKLADVELRYRQRYVDLFVNRDAREILLARMRITRAIREFMDADGFLEVETPLLQTDAGGATARPFLTHHNALDIELHLRISLELYLKRLIVGGLEKVYEIGRVFRNEGIDRTHNPEFTLLELYQAYTNLEGMMDIVERMHLHICRSITGGSVLETGGHVIDFGKPWQRLPILAGIEQYAQIGRDAFQNLETAKAAMAKVGLNPEKETLVGGIHRKTA